jgi:hypothetical protein
MSYANLMRIFYTKGILNWADPVSRLPDFLPVDNLRGPDESLYWDGNVHNIDTYGNKLALLALSTLKTCNVNNDFVSKLKGEYPSCNYFSNDNI